jgi:hypothetical protein
MWSSNREIDCTVDQGRAPSARIGNRTAGLEHVKPMFRRIPSKRLPWKKQSNKHSRTENGDDKQREYNSASEDSINGCLRSCKNE